MTKLLTKTEFNVFAFFYSKFGLQAFRLNTVKWFFSKQMLKKIIFKLVEAGWIKRIEKGLYQCNSPEENVKNIFEKRIEKELNESNLPYCFSKASAAEIWSDEVYIQRSWEYSPIYINVLKKDLSKWKAFFERKGVQFFTEMPSNVLGEFIVLNSLKKLSIEFHNQRPVEPLNETIAFCEKNSDLFEYILAYFQKKYKKKTSAGKEVLEKVSEAL